MILLRISALILCFGMSNGNCIEQVTKAEGVKGFLDKIFAKHSSQTDKMSIGELKKLMKELNIGNLSIIRPTGNLTKSNPFSRNDTEAHSAHMDSHNSNVS